MKRITAIILTLFSLLSLSSCGKGSENSIGIPYQGLGAQARIPWDLAIDNGYLYVGAGDYDKNLSPKVCRRLSLDGGNWEDCGTIADEQINRFLLLDGKLIIPGTDPKDSWEIGSYYVLEGDSFVQISTIPHGVHNFDMVSFDGKLFAALGVDDARYPVVCSPDGGETFETVSLHKDGKDAEVNTENNRIYDFLLFHDTLYLLYGKELFVYTDGCFDYAADWNDAYSSPYAYYVPILAKAALGDCYYFTTTSLYVCREENGSLGKPQEITLSSCTGVADLLVANEKLYLLTYEENGSSSVTTILSTVDGETFETELRFSHDLPPVSFAFDGTYFYIGMGKAKENQKKNGEILKYPAATAAT